MKTEDIISMGELLALSSALMYAFHATILRWGLSKDKQSNSVMEIQLINLFFGLSFLFISVLLGILFLDYSLINEFASINGYSFFLVVLEGLAGPLAGLFLVTTAIGQIGASRTTILLTTNILFTALFSIFVFGENPGLPGFLGIATMFTGIFIVSHKSEEETVPMLPRHKIKGVFLALLSALCFTFSQIARGEALDHGATPVSTLIIGCLSAMIFVTIYCVLKGSPKEIFSHFSFKSASSYAVGGILVIFARLVLLLAFTFVPVWIAVAIRNTQPLMVLLITWLFFRKTEVVNFKIVFGACLILGGIWLLLNF